MRKAGYHQSAETRAKISASHMGISHPQSPETRAKQSASHMGHPTSLETRVKQSATRLGSHPSPETRAKLWITNWGRPVSFETRQKMSAAQANPSTETRAKRSAAQWKGGPAISNHKRYAKRRKLGFVPLNSWFVDCEGHHVDEEQVIFMPKDLHRSIFHRLSSGKGMTEMNAIAYNFLSKQEVA